MDKITGKNRHPFICTDTSGMSLLEFDRDGNIVWEKNIGKICFDVWALADGKILYCYYDDGAQRDSGVILTDRDGNIYCEYKSRYEIFGCQPLANGNILAGELRNKRVIEISPDGTIAKQVNIDYDEQNLHEAMRMPRKMADGTYLVVQPGNRRIVRYSPEGKTIWSAATRPDTFGAVEKPNGNIIYTSQTALTEIDREGKTVWEVTADDMPHMGIKWLLGIQLLEHGNVAVCNWLGHGHENEGVSMFEITPDKHIVWECNIQQAAPNAANFELLDCDLYEAMCKPLR